MNDPQLTTETDYTLTIKVIVSANNLRDASDQVEELIKKINPDVVDAWDATGERR